MSARIIRIKAPAKVNLFLKVLGKRPDGFHELDTLFEALDFVDELVIQEEPSRIRLICNVSTLPRGPRNLVVQAAQLLKGKYSVSQGALIHLRKNIPVAAGLGGGSSDAAATLLGLNRFWKLRLPKKRLLKLAEELGSDVPFFILKSPYALARGRGEKLKALKVRSKLWHVLVTPRLKVLAKDVYRALRLRSLTPPRTGARMLATSLQKRNFSNFSSLPYNTLEQVLLERYPVIQRLKDDLIRGGCDVAMVSGSGPTVFGLAKSPVQARRIARLIRKKHPTKSIVVASTLT